MALVGNTVTLKAEFKTKAGAKSPATEVTMRIYDEAFNLIKEVEQTDLAEIGTGEYEYNYIIPKGLNPLYYEFTGKHEGIRKTGRKPLVREWVKP